MIWVPFESLAELVPNYAAEAAGGDITELPSAASTTGKYVPRRGADGAPRPGMGSSMPDRRRRDDTAAVRVSNLPESTSDQDIKDLFRRSDQLLEYSLRAKDKIDNKCKGFAFVNYMHVQHAEEAIRMLNQHRYILHP